MRDVSPRTPGTRRIKSRGSRPIKPKGKTNQADKHPGRAKSKALEHNMNPNEQASSANPIGITQKGASQHTLLHHNAAYHQDNGKRAKGKPEAPKAQFTTLLHRPEAVRADHSQHPKGTKFPIHQQASPTERVTQYAKSPWVITARSAMDTRGPGVTVPLSGGSPLE